MKHIPAISLAFALGLLISASCQRFDEAMPGLAQEGTFKISITCPGEGTKTALNGTKPVWKTGDQVWISDGTNSCMAVVAKEYNGQATADLTISGLTGSTLYALYPYDESASVSSGQLVVNIPAVQSGEFKDAGICVGSCSVSEPNLTLHSACPVLHFISNNETLVSMQFCNRTSGISGTMKVDAATGTAKSYTRTNHCMRLDFGDRHNEFYMAATPTTFVSGGKIIFTTSEHYIGTITMSQANSMQKGNIYEMGNLNDRIVFGSEPAADLSARESANCYVVASGKPYRLKAVKGNTSEALEDVAYAETIWETTNNSSAPTRCSLIDDLIYSDGYVYFNIPDSAPDGNALIAAKNASGEILWSWHIWILDEGVSFHTLADGYYLMDRNLGALTSEPGTAEALGFLYQWGRKDPFPGSSSISASTQARITGTAITRHNCTATTGTIEYSVKNPTDMIYNTGGGSWLNEDMLLWSADSKTVYDPCPPGYHIPTSAVLKKANTGTWNSTTKALAATVNGENVYFPASGKTYYNTGAISSVGSAGYYWYNCTTGSTATNTCKIDSDGMHFYSQGQNHYSPQAFSVRCQKISDKDESQLLTLTYSVTMPDYRYKSLWYSTKLENANSYSWGDGTSLSLKDSVTVYHPFSAVGNYSVTLQGYDIDFFKIRSLGDISEIDLSNF